MTVSEGGRSDPVFRRRGGEVLSPVGKVGSQTGPDQPRRAKLWLKSFFSMLYAHLYVGDIPAVHPPYWIASGGIRGDLVPGLLREESSAEAMNHHPVELCTQARLTEGCLRL